MSSSQRKPPLYASPVILKAKAIKPYPPPARERVTISSPVNIGSGAYSSPVRLGFGNGSGRYRNRTSSGSQQTQFPNRSPNQPPNPPSVGNQPNGNQPTGSTFGGPTATVTVRSSLSPDFKLTSSSPGRVFSPSKVLSASKFVDNDPVEKVS
jgi:hypothetical protein